MKLHLLRSSYASAPPACVPLSLPSSSMESPPLPPPLTPPPPASENIIMCIAAALPVLLGFIPILVYVVTGNIERAVKMFRMPAMAAALINSMLWLFYSLVVQREDLSWMDVTTANAFLLIINFNYIMLVLAHKRSVFWGLALSVIVLPGVTYLFMAMRWQHVLPNTTHSVLGIVGIVGQLACYTVHIWDSVTGQGDWEAAVTAMNFLPSMVLNCCVGYVTWVYHPEQFFLWIISLVNCVACTIGLMILVLKVFKDCCKRLHEAVNHDNNDENPDHESGLLRRIRNFLVGQVKSRQIHAETNGTSGPASSQAPVLPLRQVSGSEVTTLEVRDATYSACPPPAPSSPVDGSPLSIEAIAAVSALSEEYKRYKKQGKKVGKATSYERRKTIERAEKLKKLAPTVTSAGWFCTRGLHKRVPATRDQVTAV